MVCLAKDSFFEKKFLGEKLNILICLVDKKKNSLKSVPKIFSPETTKIIKLKIKEKNNFLELREFYSNYLGLKRIISVKTLNTYFSSNNFPAAFLRALSIYLKDDKIIKKLITKKIVNQRNQKIELPLSKKELLNPKLAYLTGLIFGDGYINQNQIKINDGHHNKEYLHYSKKSLDEAGNLFYEFFKKKPTYLIQRGNQFELMIVSKPICKFINFFLEMPFSPKKRLDIPKIYRKNKPCLKMFLRGLFDADGYIHHKHNYITFKSRDKKFTMRIKKALIKFGLEPSEIFFDNFNISGIRIYSRDIKKFKENISFSHPRKKEIIEKHINKGTKIKMFKRIAKNKTVTGFFDITLIKNLRVKGFGKKLKEIRKKRNLTQKEFSKILNLKRRNYARFETDELASPLKLYEKLFSKKTLLKELSKNKVSFGLGGTAFVQLELRIGKISNKLFEYMSPKKTKVSVIQRHPKGFAKNSKIEKQIEKIFNIKITKDNTSKIILSKTIVEYLKTFCIYKNQWD
ncbi:MAG: LAGLIDADG family homing endonuclease [Candidatus Diapherotrites archaeon]